MVRPVQPLPLFDRLARFAMPSGMRSARRALIAVLLLPALLGSQSHDRSVDDRLLAAHNRERAELGLPALRWSAGLARGAAEWSRELAASGQLRHSPAATGGSGHGENLWIGTAGRFAPEAMVGGWTREKADFMPGAFPRVSRTGDWADVAHYTQMVWRDTREVGCAIGRGARADVLVCRYAAPGNIVGHAPF